MRMIESKHRRQSRTARQRGTIMMEMIFSLPLLLLVLSFLFYFGRGVVRQQKAQVMDRYEAWREVAKSWGPGSNNPHGSPQLNQTFFADNAASITQGGNNFFPHDASNQLEDEAQAFSNDTMELVEESHDAFPKGHSIWLSSSHAETMTMWKRFDNSMRHRHTVLDGDWGFMTRWIGRGINQQHPRGERYNGWVHGAGSDGPWMLPQVRDVFLMDLDGPLKSLQNNGNYLAGSVRRVYTGRPVYRGPQVP